MLSMIGDYFHKLALAMGASWNRFWYTPTDPLPLCLLRIATGLVALWLHATFSADLIEFFGPNGLLAADEIAQLRDPLGTEWLCFLDYLRSPGELWLGHAAAGGVLLLYTVGYRSRLASVLALYVVLCYHHRSPMLSGYAEIVLAFMMFGVCLGPSGRYLSIDAWLARRRAAAEKLNGVALSLPGSSWGANVALRLLQVHVTLVYAMMVLGKLKGGVDGEVWWQGDAMWWLIAKPESRLVDFTWLHAHPFLVNAWTHTVVFFEAAYAVGMWSRTWRPLLLAWSVVMWTSMALVTGLVPFCLLMLLCGVVFVPGADLRALFGGQPLQNAVAAPPLRAEPDRREAVSTR